MVCKYSSGYKSVYKNPAVSFTFSFAGNHFHCSVFTLQRPGHLGATDPLPLPLTEADEELDR